MQRTVWHVVLVFRVGGHTVVAVALTGVVDEWLFKKIAGIRNMPGTNGMRHLLISPTLPGDLTYVKAHTTTLYGKVSVYCSTDTITVEIPVGCDATIQLANGFKKKVGSGKHSFGLW